MDTKSVLAKAKHRLILNQFVLMLYMYIYSTPTIKPLYPELAVLTLKHLYTSLSHSCKAGKIFFTKIYCISLSMWLWHIWN